MDKGHKKHKTHKDVMDKLMSVDKVRDYMNSREVKRAMYVAKTRVKGQTTISEMVNELNDNGIEITEYEYGSIEMGSGVEMPEDSKSEEVYQYMIKKGLRDVCVELDDVVSELSKKVDELNEKDKEKDEYGLFKYLNELKPKTSEDFKEKSENAEYKTHKVVEHLSLLVNQIKMFSEFIDEESVEVGVNVKMDAYKDARSIIVFHSK